MKAIEALYEAQKIAFSPFVFQTVITMLDLNILAEISQKEKEGISIPKLSQNLGLTEYGVTVLVEMAVSAQILAEDENGMLSLTKTGFFILNDEMTRVNFNFTQDVCYNGLFHLKEAIREGSPAGLKMLGEWNTVYEGLSQLPEHVRKSWFDFDHFYSDNSFEEALKIIFSRQPQRIYDIGGNTGKWAIASTLHDPQVKVTIFDLPGQIETARVNITAIPEIKGRVDYHPVNLLHEASEIPAGADVYWMSQFLDCFSESEIEQILLKIGKHASKDSDIYIMETFIDNQLFPAASFSLIATSLYFTAIANGNSKMYTSATMKYIVDKAGFTTVGEYRLLENSYHTILHCKLK